MKPLPPKVRAWLPEPITEEVRRSIEILARMEDIQQIALMPDAHWAENVCVGAVVASQEGLYPEAIGGDVGCGMGTVRLDIPVDLLNQQLAERLLLDFARRVPPLCHRVSVELAAAMADAEFLSPTLRKAVKRLGAQQLGTLGRGNHFLELQADDDGSLWLTVHSGSRAVGPAVQEYFLRQARVDSGGLHRIEAESELGRAYMMAHDLAVGFAGANRRAILDNALAVLLELCGARADWDSHVSCTHNFVRREQQGESAYWVHRKGALSALEGEAAIIPGSMGTVSYLVTGRGCPAALNSSSHGAGRAMSRKLAHHRINAAQVQREMAQIWFQTEGSARLVDEAPSAYKAIGAVMRAQRELTRIERRLRPVLNYKGV